MLDHVDEQLEAQLRIALEKLPGQAWYASPEGGLQFLNSRSADYLDLPKDHPLRRGLATGAAWDSHLALLHPDDHAETRRIWSTCLSTGTGYEVAFRIRGVDGTYRWFLSRAEPFRAQDGRLLWWVGMNLDVENYKQAEFYLAEAQRLGH